MRLSAMPPRREPEHDGVHEALHPAAESREATAAYSRHAAYRTGPHGLEKFCRRCDGFKLATGQFWYVINKPAKRKSTPTAPVRLHSRCIACEIARQLVKHKSAAAKARRRELRAQLRKDQRAAVAKQQRGLRVLNRQRQERTAPFRPLLQAFGMLP